MDKTLKKLFESVFLSLNEDNWSDDVSTKWKPKPGTFDGSAEEIADEIYKNHSDLKSAMASLNFYINRAGDKLSSERKAALNKAKELLDKKFSK